MQGRKGKLMAKLKSSFLSKWWFVVAVSVGMIVFGGIVAAFFTSWVDLYIDNEVILRNGSQSYGWWRKPPVTPTMSIYIYNVTNADAFLNNGEKPVLDELGPYVYRQSWEKVALEFNDNATVSFQQKKTFKFDAEASVGDIDDMVVVPNIPMLSATSQSKHAARFLRLAMASIMDILKIKPFVEVSVGQLLWGYEDPLLKLAKDVVPKEQKLPYEEFGLMYGKNGTAKEVTTVFTGASDITKYGLINRFNGQGALPHWKTEECNRINGSDGSIFPPHISKNDTLYVYDKDMCRLLPLRFLKDIVTDANVHGYRFTPPENVFASPDKNPENACFCPSEAPCAPNGLFNVSFCQYDSPIMLSWPHFYLADQTLREAVEGISPPDPEKHMLYIDVHPKLGTALGARARVQVNLAVSQVVDIKQVKDFPDIVFPIMWFEDAVEGLPEEVTGLLRMAESVPPVARAALMYGLFALGALLLALAVGCLVRSSSRQETLNLEGTQHYVTQEKNGKSLESQINPAFVGGQ